MGIILKDGFGRPFLFLYKNYDIIKRKKENTMIKLEFCFYWNEYTYSIEPYQFNNWNDAFKFGEKRCQEIMEIYNLEELCWGYKEI